MIELSIGQAVTYAVMFLIIGTIIGIVIIGLMKSASDYDREMERQQHMKNKDRYILNRMNFEYGKDPLCGGKFRLNVVSGAGNYVAKFIEAEELERNGMHR
jgi:hypothetical protein